jgi:phosphoserine phosphatase RsbU/P
MARGRRQQTLSGTSFATSRKIPEEVFRTGEPKILADLLDGELANVHMGTVALGIRHVLCVPLRLVRYIDAPDAAAADKNIGVLYLDSREKGSLLASSTRTALETLATEAAVAIENARLYRETLEKARLEQEMRIAADIQLALLPRQKYVGEFCEACGSTIPSRSIGGDFYDYMELPDKRFAFVLGDVAGKGPPAALLSAMVLGIIVAQTGSNEDPSSTLTRVNHAMLRRAIEARYATTFYGVLDGKGRVVSCNAGHNPPFVFGRSGMRRLQCGGPPLGLFEDIPFDEEAVQLESGDWIIVFSDGVSEALSVSGEEFTDARITAAITPHYDSGPSVLLEALISAVKAFASGAVQSDDVTALAVKYRGPGASA